MHITVPHNTSREEAIGRVRERLGQLFAQFGAQADDLQHEWFGDTLRFKGKAKGLALEGTVEVTDSEVVIDGKLPLLAKMFEGRIRQAVEREAEQMFT